MRGPSREEEVGKPREQKRKEVARRRRSRWLAARLVQAEGFIEHNMPRIKASETETSRPIRRSDCCGPGSQGGITAVTLSQTLSGGDKDTERARAPEACSELGGGGVAGKQKGGGESADGDRPPGGTVQLCPMESQEKLYLPPLLQFYEGVGVTRAGHWSGFKHLQGEGSKREKEVRLQELSLCSLLLSLQGACCWCGAGAAVPAGVRF